MSKAQELLKTLGGDVGVGSPTVTPSIPNVPGTADANLRQFLSAIKQVVETWKGERGDALDSSVTWRDLINKQFATIDLTNGIPANATYLPIKPKEVTDYTPPPAPTNVAADGALANILITWDEPNYGNHAYAEIWRSSTNNLGSAAMVGMAPGAVYADNVGGGYSYYYWVRFVTTSDVAGPYNATEGTFGETSLDPGYILDILSGQISESELAAALSSRINLIDAPSSTAGSVSARIQQEATTRAQAILDEAAARATSDNALQTQINTLSAASSGDFQELIAALQDEQTARISGDQAEATARQTLASQVRGSYTGTDVAQVTTGLIYSERTARTSADSALSSSISALSATVTNNLNTVNASITAEQTARANADTALSNSINTLSATVTTNNNSQTAAVQSEATARANADTALGSRIDTVQASVTSNAATLTAAVQTEASARASEDGKLQAQYTVKTDVNGYVSGFGLASTLNNATPYSNFIFKADQFAFGAPGLASAYPFVIQATATTINGVAVPPGVYIDAAYIKNGTISNAKIGNAAIDSAKIADAAIVNAKIADASITTAKIADAQITNAKIGTAAIDTAKIADATITTAKIQDAAITTAKIGSAAITEAKIADAAITAAKIGSAAITNAKIQDGAITNAKIGDAQITNAKIGNAAVDTLKIANQAVTFPTSYSGFSCVHDFQGGGGIVLFICRVRIYNHGRIAMRLYQSGWERLYTSCGTAPMNEGTWLHVPVCFGVSVSGSNGLTSFQVTWETITSNGAQSIDYPTFFILGAKR